MLNRREASWTNAFCSLKHHLHIGACHFSQISTPRCRDLGRNHFRPISSSPRLITMVTRVAPPWGGDRSAKPATYGVPGCSDLQRAHISVLSTRRRSGAEMLVTPSGVSRAATSRSDYSRGQSRETGCLIRLFGSVDTTSKCVSVGPSHCREATESSLVLLRLDSTGWFPFWWTLTGPGNGTSSRYSVKEVGHRSGSSSQKRVQVLQPVLHSSKEGCRVASHSRSASVEPLSQQTEVQDAHTQTGRVSDQVRGLVCHDQSGRSAYFHVSILTTHREFLRFAFGGEAYQYQVLPFGL